MNQVLLIDIDDIRNFKGISKNTDIPKKLEPHIQDAQLFDLKGVLGNEMYWDLVADLGASPALQKYANLWNEATWTFSGHTYKHLGLKSVLCFWAYARYMAENNETDSALGLINPISKPALGIGTITSQADENAVGRRVNSARSGAFSLMNDIEYYLYFNIELYPLWKYTQSYLTACDNYGRPGMRNKRSVKIDFTDNYGRD